MAKPGQHKGYVRIISGQWGSRRIPVADVPGLRPTGDRVRETLFNWLQAFLPGSRCLDVFAGTGALGIEAASRGAAYTLLLERNRTAVTALEMFVAGLGNPLVEIRQANALTFLEKREGQSYDIVFVDPPFDLELQQRVMDLLVQHGWLSPGAIVYLESTVKQARGSAPAGWQAYRNKTIGEVRLQLFHTPG